MKNITIKIGGMHCVSCSMNIDGELEDTPGVHKSSTSYKTQVSEIEFDPEVVTEQKLRAVIESLGYITA